MKYRVCCITWLVLQSLSFTNLHALWLIVDSSGSGSEVRSPALQCCKPYNFKAGELANPIGDCGEVKDRLTGCQAVRRSPAEQNVGKSPDLASVKTDPYTPETVPSTTWRRKDLHRRGVFTEVTHLYFLKLLAYGL
jgi:hypothetical protein